MVIDDAVHTVRPMLEMAFVAAAINGEALFSALHEAGEGGNGGRELHVSPQINLHPCRCGNTLLASIEHRNVCYAGQN